jgi:hypothetical protein
VKNIREKYFLKENCHYSSLVFSAKFLKITPKENPKKRAKGEIYALLRKAISMTTGFGHENTN